MFDHLLNINRSVVVQSQIEKEHDLSPVHDELQDFYKKTKSMSVTDRVGDTLVRLPLFYGLDEKTQDYIIENVLNFWGME